MKRLFRTMLAGGFTALLVAACGGGGGEREFAPETPGGSGVDSVQLTASSASMSSDGRQAIRLFASVKDRGNVTMAGVPVTFQTPGSGVALTVLNGTTNASGIAEAELRVQDPTNRTITVSADAAGKRAQTSIEIVGTTVSISGPESVVAGRPTVFQVSLRDASGEPVAGQAVLASVTGGVTLAQPSATTNALGAMDIILTSPPSESGAQQLRVSGAGASAQRELRFSATSVEFESPLAGTERSVSSAALPVQVLVRQAGVPVVGQSVRFNTTRGVLEFSEVLTDANGVAYTSIASDLAGRSLITATLADGTAVTRELQFVGSVASKIEVQASPTTVGVNLGGSASNSSEILAVVRDAVDNPVKGARVDFRATDPSAGAGLSQSFALTDETGRATVTFYPGAIPTGTNLIEVTATVDCSQPGRCAGSGPTKFSDSALLTAARRALQIRIGTGNEAKKVGGEPAPVFNELPYGVLVSDSAGNPVSGVTINSTLVAVRYGKGAWQRIPCGQGEPCWEQRYQIGSDNRLGVLWCLSEDSNENLRLDPGEDRNGDGMLTPGNTGVVYFGDTGESITGTTDGAGSAVMRIRYLRDRSGWVQALLRVTATVPDGTEGFEQVPVTFPVLGDDLTNEAVPPPGQPSPFGDGQCP